MQAFPNTDPAMHAQLEAQVDLVTQMSRHATEALGQLGELNLRMMRQLMDDSVKLGRALAACQDPFQMGAVAMRESQPAAEHWRAWQSALMQVLSSGGAALARDANNGSWQAARGAGDFMRGAGGAAGAGGAGGGQVVHAPA
jgi:hypothetical protein